MNDLRERLMAASRRTLNRSLALLLREAAEAMHSPIGQADQLLNLLVEGGYLTRDKADEAARISANWFKPSEPIQVDANGNEVDAAAPQRDEGDA